MKLKTAATLVLVRPDQMSLKGRRQIATWLRRSAQLFQAHGKNYGKRFTARYLYRP